MMIYTNDEMTVRTFSSYVQNAIVRFALRNDLNLVLDPDRHILRGQISLAGERLSQAEWHDDFLRNHLYHVMAVHTTFDYEGIT